MFDYLSQSCFVYKRVTRSCALATIAIQEKTDTKKNVFIVVDNRCKDIRLSHYRDPTAQSEQVTVQR